MVSLISNEDFYIPNAGIYFVAQIQSLDSAWQEVGVKSSPNVSKSYPRSSHNSFCIRVRYFKISQKLLIIWASFSRNFVTKNFQKSPNLVTLVGLRTNWEVRWNWVMAKNGQKWLRECTRLGTIVGTINCLVLHRGLT